MPRSACHGSDAFFRFPRSSVAYFFAVKVPKWVTVLLVLPYKVVVNQVPVMAVSVEHQVGWSDVPVNVPVDMQLVQHTQDVTELSKGNWLVATVIEVVLYVGQPPVCSHELLLHHHASNAHDAHIAPSYQVLRIEILKLAFQLLFNTQ